MKKFTFTVGQEDIGVRLDKFLTEKFMTAKPDINRTKIHHLIEEGCVVNEKGETVRTSQKTKLDQRYSVMIAPQTTSHLEAKDIPFEIVFEDDDLLVINKPAGLTVHPGAGNQDHTLVNGLLFTHKDRLSNPEGDVFRPGIVHRLDKDTSGLMLVAKNDFTHQALSEKLRLRDIKRVYSAFIYGVANPRNGIINKNIERSRSNRLKMTVCEQRGRTAITHYRTREVFLDGFASMIDCRLETGRTHQIRVHLESEKHSLIGDRAYGGSKKMMPESLSEEAANCIKAFSRQALHSRKIAFAHPRDGKEMSFEIPLPEDMERLKEVLING